MWFQNRWSRLWQPISIYQHSARVGWSDNNDKMISPWTLWSDCYLSLLLWWNWTLAPNSARLFKKWNTSRWIPCLPMSSSLMIPYEQHLEIILRAGIPVKHMIRITYLSALKTFLPLRWSWTCNRHCELHLLELDFLFKLCCLYTDQQNFEFWWTVLLGLRKSIKNISY